jgi:hypothetical protein
MVQIFGDGQPQDGISEKLKPLVAGVIPVAGRGMGQGLDEEAAAPEIIPEGALQSFQVFAGQLIVVTHRRCLVLISSDK